MKNFECPFCKEQENEHNSIIRKSRVVAETDNFIFPTTGGFVENYQLIVPKEHINCFGEIPVSKGHVLIITKGHAATFFDITNEEQIAIIDLLNKCKEYIDKKYHPDGYNVGLNCGESAGQSVMHVHMHLIPRYKGDVENPRGGIRGVIPNRKNY